MSGLEPFPQPPVLPVRYPVVLMHGIGVLAAIRRRGHLHREALYLRRHGVRAYAPNVAPYNPVPTRAAMWKQRIERILAETGAERVHLIAHSMGGLDARFLISELGLHEVVASLVTVSTPHRGSAICDLIQEQPRRLQSLLAMLFNWMGTAAMDDIRADVEAAVDELTPAYLCGTFNPAVPNHPSVRYWSYAGRAGKGTEVPINPFLRVQNALLYKRQGVNDGFVALESAQWGQYLGPIDADHARQVGIRVLPGGDFDSRVFFHDVVEMLAREGM